MSGHARPWERPPVLAAAIVTILAVASLAGPATPRLVATEPTAPAFGRAALDAPTPDVAAAIATATTDVLGTVSRRAQPGTAPAGPRIVETPSGSRAEVPGPTAPTRPQAQPAPQAPTTSTHLARGATAVFLGDSFTSGYNGAGFGRHNWTTIVGRTRGWHVLNLAVPGTGFRNPGWTNQPVASRVRATIRARPDIVVIAAGHNDSRWSTDSTAGAADAVITRIRRALPRAQLVIVGPIWQDSSAPRRCLVLRDHLRARAAAIGAVFVDPIGARWFAGSRHALIGPDALHPTDAGHRFIAARILAALAHR